jgi:hypothetical protein
MVSVFLQQFDSVVHLLGERISACPHDLRPEVMRDIDAQIRRRWPTASEGDVKAALDALRARATGRGNRSVGLGAVDAF